MFDFIFTRKHVQRGFYGWDIPILLARYRQNKSLNSGHWRFLGIHKTWNQGWSGWSHHKGISFWGLVMFSHHDTDGGKLRAEGGKSGWAVHFCKIRLGAAFRRAGDY